MSSNVRVYSSASRRRARWRAVLFLAASAATVLLVLTLVGTGDGDRRLTWTGAVASGSGEGDSGGLGSEDGYVAVGASLSSFSQVPAVARLDPVLREALRRAADDALLDGVTLRVNGGWRSARYQRLLFRRAVKAHGSVEVARQYALPPAESRHVSGEAVDVGPEAAAGWLSQIGSEYGLCQVYENEPWHFELATAPGGVCPPMTSNAAAG